MIIIAIKAIKVIMAIRGTIAIKGNHGNHGHQGHLRVEVAAGSNCPSSTCITAALSEG